MTKPLDKNGRELQKGQWIIPLATHQDYNTIRILYLSDEFDGQKFDHLIAINGKVFEKLSVYKNGDTDYHSVEIYSQPKTK